MKGVKHGLIYFLIFVLISFISYQPVTAAGVIPIDLLNEVETIVYGQPQQTAIIKRIEELEYTLFDQKGTGTLIERANNIINYVLPAGDNPSLVFLLNTLEWSLTNNLTQGTLVERLDHLETMVFGQTRSGSLTSRINYLMKLSLPDGKVPTTLVTISADTLIKIKLLNKISSVESQVGQKVNFVVVDNITIDKKLVIPSGTRGLMEIVDVSEAEQLGKDGKVQLRFTKLMTIDGSRLDLKLDKEAQEENRSQKLALGASLLGTAILGPVGLIAGFFVKGEDTDLPAGAEIFIQTVNNRQVYAIDLN